MKTNELFNLAINPFTRIAGWHAFVAGIVFILLTAITGTYANVYCDGVLDFHFTGKATFTTSLILLLIDLFTLIFTFSVAGMFIVKSFRLLDILGTITLSKAPFLLLTILALSTDAPGVEQLLNNPMAVFESISLLIVILASIPVLVWYITLLYNAFKVSTGAKGNKTTLAFIAALLAAEVISKVIITYLLKA